MALPALPLLLLTLVLTWPNTPPLAPPLPSIKSPVVVLLPLLGIPLLL